MTAVGRPTKYSPEMLLKTGKYQEECEKTGAIPFIEELALRLNVNDDTVVEWCKHKEFSATVKRLKTLQKLHLKKDALERKIHPTMAIFLLKANHETDEGSRSHEPIQINLVGRPSLSQLYSESEAASDKGANTGDLR
ncbi:MAG: hypothetical protein Q7S29_02975 [Candidatus Peribacter sp.]|nr:hypothetical protein [Candidatus Peribacter sp.]